jgi:hypothetical protein
MLHSAFQLLSVYNTMEKAAAAAAAAITIISPEKEGKGEGEENGKLKPLRPFTIKSMFNINPFLLLAASWLACAFRPHIVVMCIVCMYMCSTCGYIIRE